MSATTAAQQSIEAARAAIAQATGGRAPSAANQTGPTPPPSIRKPGRMALGAVVKGKIAKPLRVVLYGLEGVGKSTFAAGAPAPIFLGAEDGTSELDVHRFPQPRAWSDVFDGIAELSTAEHGYQTLVIDTLDWLEPLCWRHVCQNVRDQGGKQCAAIEDFGFGRGYTAALDEWRRLTSALESLIAKRGMHMVILAHSHVKAFKDPGFEPFDRHEMKLNIKAAGLWREWVDAVLFAAHDLSTVEKAGRVRGVMTDARFIHTQRTAAYDAKNRYDLPPRLALDWSDFYEAVTARRPAALARLAEQIEALLTFAADGKRAERVRASTAAAVAAQDAAELARIANKLAALIATDIDAAQGAQAAQTVELAAAVATDTTAATQEISQ